MNGLVGVVLLFSTFFMITEECPLRSYYDKNIEGCVQCSTIYPEGCTAFDKDTLNDCLHRCKPPTTEKQSNASTTSTVPAEKYTQSPKSTVANVTGGNTEINFNFSEQRIANSKPPKKKKFNGLELIGVVVGVIALALVITLAVILVKRRRRSNEIAMVNEHQGRNEMAMENEDQGCNEMTIVNGLDLGIPEVHDGKCAIENDVAEDVM